MRSEFLSNSHLSLHVLQFDEICTVNVEPKFGLGSTYVKTNAKILQKYKSFVL